MSVETRLHLAEPSWFLPSCGSWPCNIAVHRYVEAREYPTHDAALGAITSPGFFNPCQRGAIRENDRIEAQIGRRTATAWFVSLAVVAVGIAKTEAPIEVVQIGDVTKAK